DVNRKFLWSGNVSSTQPTCFCKHQFTYRDSRSLSVLPLIPKLKLISSQADQPSRAATEPQLSPVLTVYGWPWPGGHGTGNGGSIMSAMGGLAPGSGPIA